MLQLALGYSIGGIFAISASGFLLEIVAMVSLLCGALLSGQFGFDIIKIGVISARLVAILRWRGCA